jgi:hypothetical protein
MLVFGWSAAAHAQGEPRPRPPPINFDYVQYGVAITTEGILSAGDVCPSGATAPCILGSGGGLAVRAGYRSRGPWYVGGAYEFSRHDSSNLLRLAIMQQLRGEFRYYADRGNRLTPYASAGLGAVFYGDEWGTDTGGVTAFIGGGAEFQVSETTVIGAALVYRPLLLRGWTDSAGQRRADRYLGFGLAHVLSLEFTLEVRDPLPRW